MHCVSVYPCPDDKTNLNMINTLRKRYDCEIGYSGHSPGILDSVIAAVLNVKYIEKHITLDRTMYGTDQPSSLERGGLIRMINYCKAVLLMMGDGKRRISKKEKEIKDKLRGD
jgi:N-acetylneuraminate synthase